MIVIWRHYWIQITSENRPPNLCADGIVSIAISSQEPVSDSDLHRNPYWAIWASVSMTIFRTRHCSHPFGRIKAKRSIFNDSNIQLFSARNKWKWNNFVITARASHIFLSSILSFSFPFRTVCNIKAKTGTFFLLVSVVAVIPILHLKQNTVRRAFKMNFR